MRWPSAPTWTRTDSPVGPLLIVAGPDALLRLEFGGGDTPTGARDDAVLGGLSRVVAEWFDGSDELGSIPVAEAPQGFTRAVRRELRRVPRGSTVSYGELAARIGHPRASRAVGRAVATNPTALAVPCHRVVRSDGDLGGFAYGATCKRLLLDLEGVS